jgi:hypothetical protein
LVVWLAASKRYAAALAAACGGAALLLASWAAIDFDGLAGYPDLLGRLRGEVGDDAYTVEIIAQDVGLSDGLARGIWLAVGMAVLAALVLAARTGDERSSFVLAIAAALALSPIVWLHYFALLILVVALAQPQLGVAWFIPLAMVVTPGSGSPSPFETAVTLVAASATVAVSLRLVRKGGPLSVRSDEHGSRRRKLALGDSP